MKLKRRNVFLALLAPLFVRSASKPKTKTPVGSRFSPHAVTAKPRTPAMAWAGDKFENGETARTVLSAYLGPLATPEEISFYEGDQWDASILATRNAAGRPSLVINRLPALVSMLESRSGLQGDTLGEEDRLRLIAAIVKRNADPQRIHNYFVSCDVEQEKFERICMLRPSLG